MKERREMPGLQVDCLENGFLTYGYDMDCLTFISNSISSLAWPIATVIIALSLKTQLINLLGNLKKFKAGSFEAEFQKLEEKVKEAKDKADAVSTKFDEADDVDETEKEKEYLVDVSENERKVLESIINSQFVMRSVTGVANDTNLSKAAVNRIYSVLIDKGLLSQTKNKDGKLRWYPTNLGRRIVAK